MDSALFITIILALLLWAFLFVLISFIGGWHKLSKTNPGKHVRFTGAQTCYFQTIKIGLFGTYRSSVFIKMNNEGVLLTVFPLFRIMHPPVFINYSEFQDVSVTSFLWVKSLKCSVNGTKLKFTGTSVPILEKNLTSCA